MKKIVILGLIFINWSAKILAASPVYPTPTYNPNAMANSMPSYNNTPNNSVSQTTPAVSAAVATPAWMKTSPYFSSKDVLNTSSNNSFISKWSGDSNWGGSGLDVQQGYQPPNPPSTPDAFGFLDEDTPAAIGS